MIVSYATIYISNECGRYQYLNAVTTVAISENGDRKTIC